MPRWCLCARAFAAACDWVLPAGLLTSARTTRPCTGPEGSRQFCAGISTVARHDIRVANVRADRGISSAPNAAEAGPTARGTCTSDGKRSARLRAGKTFGCHNLSLTTQACHNGLEPNPCESVVRPHTYAEFPSIASSPYTLRRSRDPTRPLEDDSQQI